MPRGAGLAGSQRIQSPFIRRSPVIARMNPQCDTTSVSRHSGSAAISPRNSAARASIWWSGSSIAGHQTSSIWLKSTSGQAMASSVRGEPMSQEKA